MSEQTRKITLRITLADIKPNLCYCANTYTRLGSPHLGSLHSDQTHDIIAEPPAPDTNYNLGKYKHANFHPDQLAAVIQGRKQKSHSTGGILRAWWYISCLLIGHFHSRFSISILILDSPRFSILNSRLLPLPIFILRKKTWFAGW
jgi:hypothetical protein